MHLIAPLARLHWLADYIPAPPVLLRTAYRVIRPNRYRFFSKSRQGTYHGWGSLRPVFERKVLFVHIPKTAGTSISTTLYGGLMDAGHTRYRTYRIVYSDEVLQSFFKFTIVRNPFDRLVSAYHFLQAGGMTDEERSWVQANLAPYTSFEHFVTEWVTEKNIYKYYHFMPQHDFISFRGKVMMDYIGYFETIESDFAEICSLCNVENTLLHSNKSARKSDYRSYYSDLTREIVARVYAKDLEQFGYDFDGVKKRLRIPTRQT